MMMIGLLFFVPFTLMSLIMPFDEFHFHFKRGLPRWEIWGHPFDTVMVFLALLWARIASFEERSLYIYTALALLSCLSVSKDEFVHHRYCSAGELWLHAILFMIHVMILFAAVGLWYLREFAPDLRPDMLAGIPSSWASTFASVQLATMVVFFVYQVIFWGFLHPRAGETPKPVIS